MRALMLLPVLLLAGCGEAEKPAAPKYPWKAAAPAPKTEALKFPATDQVSISLVDDQILGNDFLPGGTLGLYKKGAKEYKLFLVRMADHVGPANALLEYKNHMPDAKLIPTFGAYAGTDRGQPAFIFTKGVYLLGIVGLPPDEADPVARNFAGRVN